MNLDKALCNGVSAVLGGSEMHFAHFVEMNLFLFSERTAHARTVQSSTYNPQWVIPSPLKNFCLLNSQIGRYIFLPWVNIFIIPFLLHLHRYVPKVNSSSMPYSFGHKNRSSELIYKRNHWPQRHSQSVGFLFHQLASPTSILLRITCEDSSVSTSKVSCIRPQHFAAWSEFPFRDQREKTTMNSSQHRRCHLVKWFLSERIVTCEGFTEMTRSWHFDNRIRCMFPKAAACFQRLVFHAQLLRSFKTHILFRLVHLRVAGPEVRSAIHSPSSRDKGVRIRPTVQLVSCIRGHCNPLVT